MVPTHIVSKSVGLIAEKFTSNNIIFPHSENISEPHASWCKIYLKYMNSLQSNTTISKQLLSKHSWEIRKNNSELTAWLREKNTYSLFFDGASKGNPGPSGGGGVILTPSGSIQSSFAWGLGVETNNFAEFYALWQGLRQALSLKIRNISIFGDSRLVIQAMRSKSRPPNLHMNKIAQKIQTLAGKFQIISFYHVLRHLNKQADLEANHASTLSKSIISINGNDSFCNIP